MNKNLAHFFLPNQFRKSESYKSPKPNRGKNNNWGKDRNSHGNKLLIEFDKAVKEQHVSAQEFYDKDDIGTIIEIEIEPNIEEILKSLDSKKNGIELLSIRKHESFDIFYAKVFIKKNKIYYLRNKIIEYLDPTKDKTDKKNQINPKNKKLIESIKNIDKAYLRSFWTDNPKLFPDNNNPIKWELWLRVIEKNELSKIKEICETYLIKVQEGDPLTFLDRSVLVVLGTSEQITKLLESTDRIAELRKSRETADFFVRLSGKEQKEWSDNLKQRTIKNKSINTSICILDTGISNEHTLLRDFIDTKDLHSYKSTWSRDDTHGHGTNMAGISLYGDLTTMLQDKHSFNIDYILESVKIININDKNTIESYGNVTSQAVSTAEISKPKLNRVFCMAVTSDSYNSGKPSSWSSTIDKITSGQEDDYKRLFIISAGNIPLNKIKSDTYTALNQTEVIQDPAQSWNALVVGAYTEYTNIGDLDSRQWSIVAPKGDMSPINTTSLLWEDFWIIKPDIVMEGGNCATNGTYVDFLDSLSLLTTHHRPIERLFATFGDTSSATALASQLAAKIWSKYPKLKPETVRALIVHSASWTEAMYLRFQSKSKSIDKKSLLRCYGYGVPNLDKALWSLKNELTLIVEDKIQPFKKNEKNEIKMNEIHYHQLPIPKDIIQELLSDDDLEMKVTLSYFIEPCPGERGRNSKNRYSSYGLRFEVKSPTETPEMFQKRLNKLSREEDENIINNSDNDKWFLKSDIRSKGSIHSDTWKGSGADLAEKDSIAIYPITGWWKEKKEAENSEKKANYSLIVTIKAKKNTVDIYSHVKNIITSKIQIEIN